VTVVEDFAADYFVRQGLTPHRQSAVLRALKHYEEFAGMAPELADDLMLSRFVTARVTTGLHINTVRKELNAIKPFYRWCWRQRILSADTYLRVKEVEPPRGSTAHGRPRPYSRKEIDRFWNDLDKQYPLTTDRMISRYVRGMSHYRRVASHAQHLQTQAVACLALMGGLRSSEIRFAAIEDIHPDNDYIVVRGKSPFGERQGYREVPYTETGRELTARWLDFRALLDPPHESPWLVLNTRASPNGWLPSHPLEPIKENGWRRVLTAIGPWELHRLRHTCATEWLRAGMDLEKVSKLLGHASIGQTLAYAELVNTDVARAARRGEQDFVTAVGRRHAQMVTR
jgi:site-specific recombinase XerD